MKKIFESAKFGNLTLKNRLIRSATWENLANSDGDFDEKTLQIYKNLAEGGVGAIISGFTSVRANDFYFEGMIRLADDKIIPKFKILTEIVHEKNCKIISQLALGAFYKNFSEIDINDLKTSEVEEIIENFISAAIRAEKSNFDGVQIHAAHFFFLSRFISPKINFRNDEYGGNFENRIKILEKILLGIKKNSPKLHRTIKINCSDFVDGGLDFDESLKIFEKISNLLDSIEISGNGTSVAGIKAKVNEGYFSEFAVKLAEKIKIPVICVGGWRSREKMEKILRESKIEFLSLSRPLICEPNFPKKLERGEVEISKCISCNRCYSTFAHRCIFERKNNF